MAIQTYFSGKQNIQSIILEKLDLAEKQILVAVAWFTNPILFHKLLQKQKEGVNIELIITNHEFNTNSSVDYKVIEDRGGVFVEVGDSNQLMHNKFCVIDFDTVINGSYNWTKRANNSNQENITIVENEPRVINDFIEEFERMKLVAGKHSDERIEADFSKIIKYFKLFRAFISINETAKINTYLHEIKNYSEIEHIVEHLFQEEYAIGLEKIEDFISRHSQLINVSKFEKMFLLSQINIFSCQIDLYLVEKENIIVLLEQFNHRYIIELNPLILKVLSLKKKIFEKLKRFGIVDDKYEKLEEDFNQANKEYQIEQKIEIPELSDEDNKSIKAMYREAVRLCHPDSNSSIFKDKKQAAIVFDSLVKSYKHNDINQVKLILNELRNGSIDSASTEYDELNHLRAKLATLKKKYQDLLYELQVLKGSESYQIINQYDDWNEYFDLQKQLLKNQLESLNNKYAKS